MSSVINKELVLALNKNWQPIGVKTIKDAFISMCSANSDKPAFSGLNIEYDVDRDGTPDFSSVFKMEPLTFDEWVKLPIFDWHLFVNTANNRIRVPTVIVANGYDKMPKKKLAPTNSRIWERDGGVCQVTGQKLTKKTGNVDHLIPRSRWKKLGLPGTPDTWKNKVLMHKEINSKKGDKTLQEAGLKLIRQPTEPEVITAWALITEAKHQDWTFFLLKNQ